MKADTYIEFQKIEARLDLLTVIVATLIPSDNSAELSALLADVKKRTAALAAVLPAATGSPAA